MKLNDLNCGDFFKFRGVTYIKIPVIRSGETVLWTCMHVIAGIGVIYNPDYVGLEMEVEHIYMRMSEMEPEPKVES